MEENKKHYKLPEFPEPTDIDILEGFWGNQDFDLINKTLADSVIKLNDINNKLELYEREKVKTELTYKHKYREAYLSQDEKKTESWKKNKSEMLCESEEAKLFYLEEMTKELQRRASEIRFQLEVLKNISYNVRQELKI